MLKLHDNVSMKELYFIINWEYHRVLFYFILYNGEVSCPGMEPVPEWNLHVTFFIIFTNISKRIR